MILVDTSVWVRARTGRHPDVALALADVVRADEALGHELVYLELLLGDGDATRARLLQDYAQLRTAAGLPHAEVVHFVRAHGLAHSGIGAVDAHLLASASLARAELWTMDRNLATAAVAVGLATHGTRSPRT